MSAAQHSAAVPLRKASPFAVLSSETAGNRFRDALLWGVDIEHLPSPQPLIEDWLDVDSVALLYGASGSYKSFIALDMSLSVVTGTPWLGHECGTGKVLYVIAEGTGGFGIRVAAWRQARCTKTIEHLMCLPLPPHLGRQDDVDQLTDLVAVERPTLVVIDTLAAVTPGLNENSGEDMSRVVDAAHRLRREGGGTTVLLLHHAGKDADRGVRGWSGLFGGVDTVLECKLTGSGVTLSATKQRDHRKGAPLSLVPRVVGRSVVVDRGTHSPEVHDDGLPPAAARALAVLCHMATSYGVRWSEWRDTVEGSESTFRRAVPVVVDGGYATCLDGLYRPTDAGRVYSDRATVIDSQAPPLTASGGTAIHSHTPLGVEVDDRGGDGDDRGFTEETA